MLKILKLLSEPGYHIHTFTIDDAINQTSMTLKETTNSVTKEGIYWDGVSIVDPDNPANYLLARVVADGVEITAGENARVTYRIGIDAI